ncbi:DNA-directed RNA polymerase I subunit RPA34 [Antechinus flavipes]|uniref:DNA-directed RNA polymerase I subunit RPA34 n=1 Tax=Antechinus flavipes TaxID=38775 RepID=UPI00223557C5|nr:DNA-directed RNA polymerase I subunit RPA34 [Antechinus flavipes]
MSASDVRSRLCPDDFCPATLPAEPPPSLALDALRKPGTELWLIRTPADFSPASLNGCKVPLVGFQTVKSHRNEAGVRQRYHVLSNSSACPETLLAPSSSADGQLVPAPALRGILSVIEVPRTKPSGQALHAIPTSPPPQIPPGLRPRFQAFGGQPPVLGLPAQAAEAKSPRKRKKPESAALTPSPGEVPPGQGALNSPPGQEMPEPTEQVPIQEDVAAPLPLKKKKKKKKKELEGEMLEPAGGAPEPAGEASVPAGGAPELAGEASVPAGGALELAGGAPEPAGGVPEPAGGALELAGGVPELEGRVMEPQQEVVLSPPKKKKSKKKQELGEMMELGERAPVSEVQSDLQEEKAPSSAKKKSRKREEAGGEMLTPERAVGPEEMADPPPAKRKKEEVGEILEGAEMAESLGEAEPSHTKKKKKKRRKEAEGEAPEPPQEMESLAEVPEPVTLNPSQGVEEKKKKKKKKKLHQEELEAGQA